VALQELVDAAAAADAQARAIMQRAEPFARMAAGVWHHERNALYLLRMLSRMVQRLEDRIGDQPQDELIESVRRAVGIAAPPVHAAGSSFPTAIEAAIGIGESVRHAWVASGAPGVLQDYAPSALVYVDTGQGLLAELEQIDLPPDLWGRIQQEYYAASEMQPTPAAKRGRSRKNTSRDEVNQLVAAYLVRPDVKLRMQNGNPPNLKEIRTAILGMLREKDPSYTLDPRTLRKTPALQALLAKQAAVPVVPLRPEYTPATSRCEMCGGDAGGDRICNGCLLERLIQEQSADSRTQRVYRT